MAPATALDSHFDPIQLLGSNIPFMDPFAEDYDNNARASGFDCSSPNSTPLHCLSPATVAVLASSQEANRTPAFQLLESMPLQRTLSLRPVLYPEHSKIAVVTKQVAKLTPGQAVHIFKQARTRTHCTASLLAVEYGVTSKAIRDIWRSRSWAWATLGL